MPPYKKTRCFVKDCNTKALGSYLDITKKHLKKYNLQYKTKEEQSPNNGAGIEAWEYEGTPLCEKHKKILEVCEDCDSAACNKKGEDEDCD